MKTITPPIKTEKTEDHNNPSIVFVKQNVQLVSSIISYEDPYVSLYEYMIEESD